MDDTTISIIISYPNHDKAQRNRGRRLQILDQTKRIVDCRMRVAGRHRIAYAKKLERAFRGGLARLFRPTNKIVVVEGTEIARHRLQFKIQIVHGNRSVIHHDLIMTLLLADAAVITAHDRYKTVIVPMNRSE